MATSAEAPPRRRRGPTLPGVWADQADERVLTTANGVTAARTVGAVALAGVAAQQHSLVWLIASLLVYWVGDVLDGWVARRMGCETRTGAVLDILSDRLCAASFYGGLMWVGPAPAPPGPVFPRSSRLLRFPPALAVPPLPPRRPHQLFRTA